VPAGTDPGGTVRRSDGVPPGGQPPQQARPVARPGPPFIAAVAPRGPRGGTEVHQRPSDGPRGGGAVQNRVLAEFGCRPEDATGLAGLGPRMQTRTTCSRRCALPMDHADARTREHRAGTGGGVSCGSSRPSGGRATPDPRRAGGRGPGASARASEKGSSLPPVAAPDGPQRRRLAQRRGGDVADPSGSGRRVIERVRPWDASGTPIFSRSTPSTTRQAPRAIALKGEELLARDRPRRS
jgi:hypothetical protein